MPSAYGRRTLGLSFGKGQLLGGKGRITRQDGRAL
jgi:hypothetical protein